MKTVLITGAAGALGTAVVQRFLQGGCQVYATDRQKGSHEPHARLHWITMDVTDPASVRDGIRGIAGGVDGLIHCAGGFRWVMADQVSDADLEFLMNVNLKSAFLLARELLPGMKERNYGRIVFISSKATLDPPAGMGAYAASKAGLNMLTLSLAQETKKHDITVNAVMPTIIDTPANRKDMPGADYSTWVSTAQLAEILFSLTQPASKPIHGALIPVSGRV